MILNVINTIDQQLTTSPISGEKFDSKLTEIASNLRQVKRYLKRVDTIGFKNRDYFFVSVLSYLSVENNNNIDVSNVKKYLKISNIQLHLSGFFAAVQRFSDKRLLTIHKRGRINTQIAITLHPEFYESLLSDSKELRLSEEIVTNSALAYFARATAIVELIGQSEMTYTEAFRDLNRIAEHVGRHSTLVSYLDNVQDISIVDRIILIICTFRYIQGTPQCDIDELIDTLTNEDYERSFSMKRSFMTEESPLILNKHLLLVAKDGFKSKVSVKLSDTLKGTVKEDCEIAKLMKVDSNILYPDVIKIPTLIYDDETKEQVERLTNILQPNKFVELMTRMSESNLNTAFCVALIGDAGSGKSSLVKKIAVDTGRPIYKIDLSKFRSAYYGQSEKEIKTQFSKYYDLDDPSTILLIEEMDGLFEKRRVEVNHSSDSTDNRIQNLLLDEIENMPLGRVLIGTANNSVFLQDNAYNRRFLVQIEINTPDFLTRKQLAKQYLSGFNEKFYHKIAENEGLTGGLLSNVAKQVTIDHILNTKVDEERILDLIVGLQLRSRTTIKGYSQ